MAKARQAAGAGADGSEAPVSGAPSSGEEGGGFDARLARLEALVGELEEGGLDLEPAIERYAEGVALLRECHARLVRYRARVEELSRGAEEALRPFDADPDAPASAGDPA